MHSFCHKHGKRRDHVMEQIVADHFDKFPSGGMVGAQTKRLTVNGQSTLVEKVVSVDNFAEFVHIMTKEGFKCEHGDNFF